MSVDRAKVRALMKTAVEEGDPEFEHADAIYAWEVLALLSELEQAERERDGAILAAKLLNATAARTADRLEARLAKVPALVEAASNAKSWIENYPLNADHEADWAALTEELGSALKAWEAE